MKPTNAPEPRILVQSYPSNVDARIYAFNKFLSAKDGPPRLATASAEGKIGDVTVGFAIPSHAAICLHLSNQAHIKANTLTLSHFVEKNDKSAWIHSNHIGHLYNYFEQIFLNVVFAHTAVEAYSNQIVPDDYIFTKPRQDKKCTETYNKSQIEKNLSLDLKLSEILPEITGAAMAKGSALWNEYTKLRDIRDRIIHVKSIDLGIIDVKAQSIWWTLLENGKTDFSLTAHKLIKHFRLKHDPSSSPVAIGRDKWIDGFPFNKPKPAPKK